MKPAEETTQIETTIGELIFAIAEAAAETEISDEEISALTQAVLGDILSRQKTS